MFGAFKFAIGRTLIAGAECELVGGCSCDFRIADVARLPRTGSPASRLDLRRRGSVGRQVIIRGTQPYLV